MHILRMFLHTFIYFIYFDLHALHWRDLFYLCFFFLYATTVRNDFCSSILIIALCSLNVCVCIVLLYTVIYTHTTHSHFRFVILRFVSALVKCSWPIDKKFEKLGDKNTPSQRKLLRALADFVLIVQLCGRPSILREQDN